MKVAIKKIDKLKRNARIEVSGDEFQKERKAVISEHAKKLKVPGFRPGAAPLELLEKHHGSYLQEAFLKKTLPHFYQKALQQEGVVAVNLPRIYDVEVSREHLAFSAEFETKPELEIKESLYKGIAIKSTGIVVQEIDIEKAITSIKDQIKKTLHKDLTDSEIAKWASYPDVEEFRQALKVQLSVEKQKVRRQDVENQIRRHLLKNVKVDLPQSQIEEHHKQLVSRELYALQYRGLAPDDIEKYKSEIEAKLQPVAAEEIRLFYIFEAIARQEGFAADDGMIETVVGFILSQAKYVE